MSSDSDWATPITEGAAKRAEISWRHFRKSIYCDEEAPLGVQVRRFAELFGEDLREAAPQIEWDDEMIMLVVIMGIEQTGMFSFDELEAALDRRCPGGETF